ncbi:MAG: extracellular solute-binding protein [Lachnospiraceae bacterium]|nr:extracellular solute-binding protein [Lachnospiraceae bacterium]
MGKKMYGKAMTIIMMISMILSIASCGKNQEQQGQNEKKEENHEKKPANGVIYEEKDIHLENIKGKITIFRIKEDKIYFIAEQSSTQDNEGEEVQEYKSVLNLYKADQNGEGLKEIYTFEINENQGIYDIMVNSSQEILLAVSTFDNKTGSSNFTILKIDENGRELENEDITENLKATGESHVNSFLLDSEDRMIISVENEVKVLDENYKLIHTIKGDISLARGLAFSKDGKIICGGVNQANSTVVIELDIEEEQWGETYNIDSQDVYDLLDGKEYDFYYKYDDGIYGYNTIDKSSIKVMDFFDSNINPGFSDSIIPIGEEEMLGYSFDETGNLSKIVKYVKADHSVDVDNWVITVGFMSGGQEIKNHAIEFNKKNKKYKIEIKDYYDEEDPEVKINADIAAGNFPDIIFMDELPYEQYAAKGLLEDLTPYFEKDSEINTSDMVDSVLEAIKKDGKIYYYPPLFYMNTLAANSKIVNKNSKWTFHDLKEIIKNNGTEAFGPVSKSDLLDTFLRGGSSDFIDYQTGKCSFDSQDFKDILEICNSSSNEETEYNEDYLTSERLIHDEKISLSLRYITNIEDILIDKQLFNGNLVYIGFPGRDEGKSYFEIKSPIGIYSKSKVKEGAWEFIRTFMTKEYQGKFDEYNSCIPLRKDCLDMKIKRAMTTETYTDELGQEVTPIKSSIDWGDIVVDIAPADQEEINMFMDLINHTKRVYHHNAIVNSIIQEEAAYYFAGEKNLDDTVKIIQNRVETYVNEKR